MAKTRKQKLLLLGAGGNATVIASVIEDLIDKGEKYEILGYLDDNKKKGSIVNSHQVLGIVADARSYIKYDDVKFIYTLITAKRVAERVDKLIELDLPVERFATLVHPSASVSRYSSLGRGVVVMPGVVISPNVHVGDFVLIHSNSLIGHDAAVEDYCFLANCSSVGSTVKIGKGAYIGSNSSIRENIIIGENALVGLGAVVTRNVPSGVTVVGNPAKTLS